MNIVYNINVVCILDNTNDNYHSNKSNANDVINIRYSNKYKNDKYISNE